ncbi:cytochrome P450 [Agrocybe pediades]|nr:cytochrome P450 [Agrocybe pediades]
MHNGVYLLLPLVLIAVISRFRRSSKPYPPGPKPVPVIGNVKDVPAEAPWKTFQEWRKQFGDIIYFHTFGKPVIILNSASAAHDLLDKRGAIYSYRPQFAMANEVIGWNFSLTSMDYCEKSKRQRKYMQSYLSKQLLPNYYPIQRKEVHKMLMDILQDPSEYRKHIKRMAGAVTIMLTYGHQVDSMEDHYITIAEKGVQTIRAAGAVGAHIVDLVPWLRFIPEWMPGGGFAKLPPGTREDLQNFIHTPFNEVKKKMAQGTAVSCYTTALLEETKGQDDEGVRGTAALTYSGGIDTTMSFMMTAFTMALANPIIQARIQAELDLVVGKDSLPDFSHRDQMPYTRCFMSEALRWGAATPVGVPHRLSEDDFYNGYFLPKDSMVMANQWAMLHDERVYYEPEKFNPDRFMPREGHTPEPDPRTIAFGFGRRSCPGNNLAENTVWLSIVSLLYAFKISPETDEKGVEIPVVVEYDEGSVRHPRPLKCVIRPRRQNSAALIRQALESWS